MATVFTIATSPEQRLAGHAAGIYTVPALPRPTGLPPDRVARAHHLHSFAPTQEDTWVRVPPAADTWVVV